jgi:uncharacterized protein (DUF1015 family)
MADSPLIRPFTAIRPDPAYAAAIAARPYDVLSLDEAVAGAAGRPHSFLHVSRAEIDLPASTDPYSASVYAQAEQAMARLLAEGVLRRDSRPAYYVYRMRRAGHVQTGVAAAASIAAYRSNRVRRHEHTRPEKELDRTRQIEAVGAHTGPVLTVHPPDRVLAELLSEKAAGPAVADAFTDDGVRHQVWVVDSNDAIETIGAAFEAMSAIYIADGHHRSAAAARLAEEHALRGAVPRIDDPRFLIVSFPTDQVRILDYNRVVRDLNGATAEAFLARLQDGFEVASSGGPVRPERKGVFGMYLAGRWYRLVLSETSDQAAPIVDQLDVSRLSQRILKPLLGISDLRTDKRIDFVGGGRGLEALVQRVDGGEWAIAFALFPTSLTELMAVADAGEVMPPKSTWFEPKLADGLLSLPLG